jgi:ATP-dependent RNA helicase DDX23/PRP28
MNSENEKRRKLEQLLREGPPPPIIIFANQRRTCDALSKALGKLDYKCTILQGGKSQVCSEQRVSGLICFVVVVVVYFSAVFILVY